MQGHRSRRVEERGKKLLRYEAELSIAGARPGLEERRGELFRDLMQAEQRIDELPTRSMARPSAKTAVRSTMLGKWLDISVCQTMIQFCSSVSFFEDSAVDSRALIG
jgi:hypothetical protein